MSLSTTNPKFFSNKTFHAGQQPPAIQVLKGVLQDQSADYPTSPYSILFCIDRLTYDPKSFWFVRDIRFQCQLEDNIFMTFVVRRNPKTEKEYGMAPFMNDYEKRISFLNRYFVFQKIATRNVEKLTKSILDNIPGEFEFEEKQTAIAQKAVQKANEEIKPKAKNLRRKLKLQEATEVQEEQSKLKDIEENVDVFVAVKEAEPMPVVEHVLETKKVMKPKKTKKLVELIEEVPDQPEKDKEKKKTTRKKKTDI